MTSALRAIMASIMVTAILLPSCPCQLQKLLAGEVFKTCTVKAEGKQEVSLTVFANQVRPDECHCDEEGRTFSEPNSSVHSTPSNAYAPIVLAWINRDEGLQKLREHKEHTGRSPPTIEPLSQSFLSLAFLCTYRI